VWRALPALEELQTAWEKKRGLPRFELYKRALTDGLEKLKKYYSRLDEKPSFVLALGKLSERFQFFSMHLFIDYLQFFTHTLSWLTSSLHGGVRLKKRRK
jgi:hypothetical protein